MSQHVDRPILMFHTFEKCLVGSSAIILTEHVTYNKLARVTIQLTKTTKS